MFGSLMGSRKFFCGNDLRKVGVEPGVKERRMMNGESGGGEVILKESD